MRILEEYFLKCKFSHTDQTGIYEMFLLLGLPPSTRAEEKPTVMQILTAIGDLDYYTGNWVLYLQERMVNLMVVNPLKICSFLYGFRVIVEKRHFLPETYKDWSAARPMNDQEIDNLFKSEPVHFFRCVDTNQDGDWRLQDPYWITDGTTRALAMINRLYKGLDYIPFYMAEGCTLDIPGELENGAPSVK